jgi:hypothetical protein
MIVNIIVLPGQYFAVGVLELYHNSMVNSAQALRVLELSEYPNSQS